MKRKLISVLLALTMVFCLSVPAMASSGTTPAAVTGTYNAEDGTVTITGTLPDDYTMLRILDEQNGRKAVAYEGGGSGGGLNLTVKTGVLATDSNTRYVILFTGTDANGSAIGKGYVVFDAAPATYGVTVVGMAHGTVTADKATGLAAGATVTLTVVPESGYRLKEGTLKVTGSDTTPVAVTGSGNVYTFTMPAKDVTVTAQFELASNVSVTGVTLNKTSLSLKTGGSETLTATVKPDDAANKKVAWVSSDPTVATVDANGKVTALKEGTATITVTTEDGGFVAACKVTVTKASVTPPSHTHAPSSAWSSDANGHWHACACGEKFDYAAHTLTSTVTRYPTATTAGERTYSCSVCGYSYKESIPATGYPYQPDDPGAGGDGTPTPSAPTYSVSAPSSSAVKGGSVSLSSKNPSKGSTVTITVKPDSGYELDFITAVDASGNSVALTNAGSNKYTFVMPASKVTLDYAFKAVENTTPVEQPTQQPATPSMTFTDVPAGAYYAGAVAWAVEQGITTGTSATTFAPDAPCTRGQIVTFLWRAAGSPKASASNPFTDVKESDYWYDAVLWAVSEGITTGTTAAAFAPNDTCTRAHAVTFLYRASGSPAVSGSGSFTDVDVGAYYANAVQWAVANGITNGTSANTFGPNDTCTRGHIVTFLYRDRA